MVFPKKKGSADEIIDASPDNPQPQNADSSRPRNIAETKVWKESTGSAKRAWSNYVNMLGERFQMLSRYDQELFITRLSIIFTMGAAIIIMVMFYSFLPREVRLLALPASLVVSYLAGIKIVTPIMISRYEQFLNRE